ncbi:MAG TPA: tryptophanase, partial [Saprospiraceae bacterium]|nr:tryptophanase [Saprospiraceae bacterium]
MKTIIEPFRIKSVEPLRFNTALERSQIIERAFYNPFLIHSEDVIIDLLTDSGTSAMSSKQWAGLMQGDESYACSPSFYHFENTVRRITGMEYIIPTHQGRAAENILFTLLGGKDKTVLSNTLFDTTRANIEFTGARGIDLPCPEGNIPSKPSAFKGNIDLDALQAHIKTIGPEKIPMVIMTVTNNSNGGQPVSMENIRNASLLCKQFQIPF